MCALSTTALIKHILPRALTLLTALVMIIGATSRPAQAQGRDVPPAPWTKPGASGDSLSIVLVTIGPGDDVPSWFGHTAIVVEDKLSRQSRAYNYGMFSFGPDMVPKYLMGRLEFWVGVVPYRPMLRLYERLDRDIRLTELNLPPDKRLAIARALEENILPENRTYLYHHYDDNCATRIRDMIDIGTDGQFDEYGKKPAAHDLRGHTRRHAVYHLLGFGMMYAMSSTIDGDLTANGEMFLPEELERHVLAFEYKTPDGKMVPLAGKHTVYYKAKNRAPTPDEPRPMLPWLLFWGFLAGGSGFLLVKKHAAAPERKLWRVLTGLHSAFIGFSFGGMGTVILIAWIITDHTVMHHNENLFMTNPFTLLLLPVGLMFALGKERGKRWLPRLWIGLFGLASLGIVIKILPWFYQQNYLTIALCMTMLGLMALASKLYLLPEKD